MILTGEYRLQAAALELNQSGLTAPVTDEGHPLEPSTSPTAGEPGVRRVRPRRVSERWWRRNSDAKSVS